ncbi:MAG: hypothetical protein EHM19_03780 [Candidatus Latescibacterota bacterium]|nr:MAG: hypothetical protein EHM19_03780 [Candidatus Latescibacterota bacterium]
MNRWLGVFAFVLAAALAAEIFSGPARSAEPESGPFVGFTRDAEGHWAALRANGEVYVSEGTGWLDRMEYRYTIRTLEEAFSPKQ